MALMRTISDAKKRLADRFRREDGFVGVGTFRRANVEGIRVYVADARFPVAVQLAAMSSFEGFPLMVEVSGSVQAQGR